MIQLVALLATTLSAHLQPMVLPQDGEWYKVVRTAKVGGDGGFDYLYADSDARKLYIARSGPTPRMTVFNLDTLEPAGELPGISAHGAVTDTKTGHAFSRSKPIHEWDANTLAPIKTIDVEGRPDGMLSDPFNHRIYVFSHSAPNVTVLDAAEGTKLGTIDLGGAPEQAVTDNNGHIYVDIEDKDSVAVIDAASMKVTANYSLNGKGSEPAGLGLDAVNGILFVACHSESMVMLDAKTGAFIASLPIGKGVDGGGFNPATLEAFSSQGDGTLSIIKETSPTTFVAEQTLKTKAGARTMTIDAKTGHVFVCAGEYGPAPAPTTPGGRPGRRPMLPGTFTILELGK